MPLYDYACERCGQVREFRHGMDEHPVYYCCLRPLKRVYSAPYFQEDRLRF
jgi:putative FmdB family regulatory protein